MSDYYVKCVCLWCCVLQWATHRIQRASRAEEILKHSSSNGGTHMHNTYILFFSLQFVHWHVVLQFNNQEIIIFLHLCCWFGSKIWHVLRGFRVLERFAPLDEINSFVYKFWCNNKTLILSFFCSNNVLCTDQSVTLSLSHWQWTLARIRPLLAVYQYLTDQNWLFNLTWLKHQWF